MNLYNTLPTATVVVVVVLIVDVTVDVKKSCLCSAYPVNVKLKE